MCATTRRAKCGGRRHFRFARRPRPIPCATARVIAGLNMPRTGSRSNFCNMCPIDDPIKISRLKITNQSGRERRLSVTAYVEWVLGELNRSSTAPFIVTEIDPETGAIFARNPWNEQFGERVAFADLKGRQTAWTGDRTEFIGRDSALDRPLGLAAWSSPFQSRRRGPRSVRCPSNAGQVGASRHDGSCLFSRGGGEQTERAGVDCKIPQAPISMRCSTKSARQWDDTLGTVQVKTPDRSLDILLNRWLPYQTLACRVWARAGFYQASGAYGFRDQLQDVMALCVSRPDVARAHLLRAAGAAIRRGRRSALVAAGNRSAASARGSPMTGVGWLTSLLTMCRSPPISRSWMRWFRSLKGPSFGTASATRSLTRRSPSKQASLFEHCALALDTSLCNRCTRPAAHGHRRLERRHGPGRRRGKRRERLARLVLVLDAECVRQSGGTVRPPGVRGALA